MTHSPDPATAYRGKLRLEFGAYLFLFCAFALAIWLAADFPRSARLFPQAIGIAGVLICGGGLARVAYRLRHDTAPETEQADYSDLKSEASLREVLPYVGWIVALLGGACLVGFLPAAAIFSLAFLLRVARARVVTSVLMTALAVAVIYALGWALNISWPVGLLV